jgi:hypothetical protein
MDRKIPSPTEVEDAKTAKGGWTKDTFAAWGVEWPPQPGWKELLRQEWEATRVGSKKLKQNGQDQAEDVRLITDQALAREVLQWMQNASDSRSNLAIIELAERVAKLKQREVK